MPDSKNRQVIKQRRLQDDAWQVLALAEGESASGVSLPAGPLLVPLAVWKEHKPLLLARAREQGTPPGIWLAAGEDVAEIAADLHAFAVIAVHFPKFTDGRGYSTARLLRERYAYTGELRAFGDIGRDQLFYLGRVGFDAFVLGEGRSAEDALSAFDDFPEAYQAGVDQPLPLFRRRAA